MLVSKRYNYYKRISIVEVITLKEMLYLFDVYLNIALKHRLTIV